MKVKLNFANAVSHTVDTKHSLFVMANQIRYKVYGHIILILVCVCDDNILQLFYDHCLLYVATI